MQAKLYKYTKLSSILLFTLSLEIYICGFDNWCAGDWGEGQVCQEPANHQALPGPADHPHPETSGTASCWVSWHAEPNVRWVQNQKQVKDKTTVQGKSVRLRVSDGVTCVVLFFYVSFIEGCSLRQKEQPSLEGSSYVVQSVPIHNSQPACWSGINLSKQWWHTVCAVLTTIVSLQASCTEITNKFPIVENCI